MEEEVEITQQADSAPTFCGGTDVWDAEEGLWISSSALYWVGESTRRSSAEGDRLQLKKRTKAARNFVKISSLEG